MSDANYIRMLEELYKKLPSKKSRSGRFKIPRVESFYHGNKTVLINFKEIADYLNREYKTLRVFLAKELASPAAPSDRRLIFHSKIDQATLQSAIEYFIKKYVICPICKGPDTQLVIERKNWYLKCEICGAISSVPPIKG